MPDPSEYAVVCFGEVLWDVLPTAELPGGAPMNVAYHLKKLGTNPALITKIGLDNYGQKLRQLLRDSRVATNYFYVDNNNPTGLVYANTNNNSEVSYDIVFPSAWDFIEWKDEMQHVVQNAAYFVFGSLTSRHRVSRDTLFALLEVAQTRVLDINLRPPHYNRTIVENLLQKADILKMNVAELELITDWYKTITTTEDRIKLIQDKFGIETVIVTLGGDGAIVNDKGTMHHHAGFKVQVKDTIGSGDSFLAGFLHKSLTGASIDEALAFASGIGAFIATQAGACPQYEISQIKELMGTVEG